MSVAVVTGASSGIGKAIFQHLVARRQYDSVIGVSLKGPDIAVDLSSYDGCRQVVKEAQRLGVVRLLVNAAGIWESNSPTRTFDVNYWAPVFLTNAFLDDLEEDEGCVINIASTAARMAEPDNPMYAASKAALVSFTKSYAVKYAPKIRFNSISPGLFRTEMFVVPASPELLRRVPVGYEASPREILPVVDTILSSPYINGADFVIDGGLSLNHS